MFRDRRRHAAQELHDARRPGRRLEDRNRRGTRRGRRAERAAAVLQRAPCAPVRLLHAGDADERDRAAAQEPAPVARRDPQSDPGQHLPLHRLREHRRGDQGGGGMNARATGNIRRRSRALPGGSFTKRSPVRPQEEGGPRGKHGFPRAETVAPAKPAVVEEGKPRPGWAGQNVPRKEDKRLVRGEGVFFDDIKRHEMGYVHFVRSPYAHARIKSVDVSKALEVDGVYGTLTGDEVAILTDPFFELSVPPGAHMKDYALAVGKVRFVGEPVAAVVAATRDLARDAAQLVEVDYEPLPPLVDARVAEKGDAPILHDEAASNVVWEGTFDWGDYEAAVGEADHVVKIKELHFDRFSSTPLECSGCLVEYNRGTGQWTMYCNHQMPGIGAIWMAPALRVGLDKLRFVTQDIGGAF